MQVIGKQDVKLLIDTLIRAGGGQNPFGKMSEILKLITDKNDVRNLRNTLLLWFDSMSIFDVDFQFNPPKYKINKPVWMPGALDSQYFLIGGLTLSEIELLEKHPQIERKENKIVFRELEIELPDTYYTQDLSEVEELGYEIINHPLFVNIENDPGLELIVENVFSGVLQENPTEGGKRISFIRNDQSDQVIIENQDNVQLFDWISRRYNKCNLKEELTDDEGRKLILIEKKFSDTHIEKFTLILNRELGGDWEYQYFDSTKLDERWARYIFLSGLTHFDLHRFGETEKLAQLLQNIQSIKENSLVKIEPIQDLNTNNVIKVPNELLKQLIHYDKRKGILAIPVNIPLPKKFMKYLYSCSGSVPQLYQNNFSRNPLYGLKVLYSGRISTDSVSITFPDESFFMKEDFYLFTCIPDELANSMESKLGLNFYKRTFFETS